MTASTVRTIINAVALSSSSTGNVPAPLQDVIYRTPSGNCTGGNAGSLYTHRSIHADDRTQTNSIKSSNCTGDTFTCTSTKTSYFNNAEKIAPYSITTASVLSKSHLLDKDENNDSVDTNHNKDVKQQLFEQELSNVIQEILPPSFWEVDSSRDDNDNDVAKSNDVDEKYKNRPSFLDRFEIKSLEGGLSNHLFTVTNKYTDETVLVRIHPSEEEHEVGNNDIKSNTSSVECCEQESTITPSSFINREHENKIVSYLSKYNIGPKFYGRFMNGRIEEYYKNHKTLLWNEMSNPDYAKGIAVQMSNLHCVEMDKVLINEMEDGRKDDYSDDGEIWNRVDTWLNVAKTSLSLYQEGNDNNINSCNKKEFSNHQIEILNARVSTIEKEWEWYKQEMKKGEMADSASSPSTIEEKAIQFCRQVVFTHMDCQSLNILTPDDTSSISSLASNDIATSFSSHIEKEISNNQPLTVQGTDYSSNSTASHFDHYSNKGGNTAIIRLIDFEYSSLNRRVIDIANTFLEHCDMNNLKPQYETEYPSDEEQNLFLMSYIRQCLSVKFVSHNSSKVKRVLGDLFCSNNNAGEISEDVEVFLNTVRNEVTKHTLFSHLEWSCWSIIQSVQSTIDFDYVKYSDERMKGYFYFKNLVWKKPKI